MTKDKVKRFALKHPGLLVAYRKTFGKIKTKYFFGIQGKSLQKNGDSLINQIDKILSKYGPCYFIDCGTLLGYIRDNRPIEYDRDLDFGVYFNREFTPEMLDKSMRDIGLKKVSTGYYRGEPQEITYSNGILHIDFFRHTEVDNNSLLYIFYRDIQSRYPSKEHTSIIVQKRLHIPALKRINLGNVNSYIPENAEEYLASVYTENWKTPDPKWHYTMEPGCTFLSGEFGIKK